MDGGISIKFIQAYEAFYVENHEQLNLTKLDNEELLFSGGDISFAYSGMAFNDNTSSNFQKNGNGIAMDLGLTYTVRSGKKANEYQWKVGLSLLDFGKVWMKDNAEKHSVNVVDLFDIAEGDFQNVESVQDLTTLITDEVYNGQGTSLQDDKFSLWLPGGVSLQAEYGGLNPFYINMMMVRRIRTPAPGVERGNLFAITPRVEIKWFAVSLPLLLYNDRDFRMGTAIRLGPITIGSDNLMSIVKQQSEFTGSDVYVALKINPFNLGKGGKGSGSKRKGGLNCYSF